MTPTIAPRFVSAFAVAIAVVLTSAARGDTITLHGRSFPLTDCTIDSIEAGRVYFDDARGRSRFEEVNRIAKLGFDGHDALDAGQQAMIDQDRDTAVAYLRVAAFEARDELPRLWTHVQLAQVHSFRGEFVEASGHLGTVLTIQSDPYWRRLAPNGEPNQPTLAAAAEAVQRLSEARRAARDSRVQRAIDTLLALVQPVRNQLAANYRGPAVDPRNTISGLTEAEARAALQAIIARVAQPLAAPPENDPTANTPTGAPAPLAPERVDARSGAADASARAIDQMLREGRAPEAVEMCRQIAQAPGERDLARFLHQYGASLRGVDEHRDAAIMFVRCAVLYPGSEFAAPSLVETALIYRDIVGDHDGARRLLDRASELATVHRQSAVVDRIRQLKSTVGDGNRSEPLSSSSKPE